jgi:hypothetical protein
MPNDLNPHLLGSRDYLAANAIVGSSPKSVIDVTG